MTNEQEQAEYLRQLAHYWRQYDTATGGLRASLSVAIELHIRVHERRSVLRELQDFHD